MNGGAGGFNGLGNMPQNDSGEMDDDTLMQELLEAAKAGDDAESEGMAEPVPGAEQGGEKMDLQASGVTPEQLQQLLEMLKNKEGSSDMGGSSPMQSGPSY